MLSNPELIMCKACGMSGRVKEELVGEGVLVWETGQ